MRLVERADEERIGYGVPDQTVLRFDLNGLPVIFQSDDGAFLADRSLHLVEEGRNIQPGRFRLVPAILLFLRKVIVRGAARGRRLIESEDPVDVVAGSCHDARALDVRQPEAVPEFVLVSAQGRGHMTPLDVPPHRVVVR